MARKVLVVLVAAVLFCSKAFPQGTFFWDWPDAATAGDSDVLLIDHAGAHTLKNVTVGEVRKIPAAKITDSTALGRNFLQLNNGSGAVRYAQINADGSITLLDSAAFLTAIGGLAPSGNGSALTGLSFVQLGGTATDAQIPATIARDAEVAAGYQPLDADLTSLAATAGTNTLYYRSAPDTWSAVTIGANLTFAGGTLSATGGGGGGGGDLFAANNLSELTNKATARSNLQLVIGTDVLAPSGNGSALTGLSFVQLGGTATDAQIPATIARDAEVAAGYQPLDSDLTAIAAFTTTAFGRGLLDEADASAARVTLGLVIGTDVLAPNGNGSALTGFTDAQIPAAIARDAEVAAGYQPLDSDLTSIAALTTTPFGRGFLDDADATAARVTLGLVIGTDVLAPNGNGSALTGLSFVQLGGTATDAQIPATIARDAEVAAGYQPLDADLTSLAATSGTNTLYYRSASGTWSPVTIGSNLTFASGTLSATGGGGGGGDLFAANNLSELTNKATARSNLQLVIGTDVLAPSGNGSALTGLNFSQLSGTATDAQIPATIARDAEVAAGYQPLDSDLTAIAALTTTPFGRGFLDDADATAARVTLGLVIGTDVLAPSGNGSALTGFTDAQIPATIARDAEVAAGYQPLDSDLTAIAALTTTAFGRGFLDDADATAARVTLGLVIGTNVLAPSGNGSALTGLIFGQLSGTTTDAQIPATIARDAEVAAGYQPLNANLTTFAGISPSANVVSFLGAANYAAMRTQLTLVPGTDIQAFDSDLNSLASASGTNTIYYRSALNTWSPVTIGTNLTFVAGTLDVAVAYQPLDSDLTSIAALTTTAFGRGLLDDANAAAGRTTLELNTPSGWTTTDKLVTVGPPSSGSSPMRLDAGSGVQVFTQPVGSASDIALTFIPKGTAGVVQFVNSSNSTGFGIIGTTYPGGGGIPAGEGIVFILNNVYYPSTASGLGLLTLASPGTSSTVLHGNGSGAPAFGPVSLTSDVSGILPPANLAEGTPVLGQVPIYQSDGTVDWASITATSAGSAKQIQYAGAGGTFASEAGFEYDAATNTFTVANINTTDLVVSNLNVNVPINYADNVKQTFNPGVTTPGFNFGSYPGDPSGAANGDAWYDSTGNLLRARINGTNVSLGTGGGATAWSSIGNAAGNASISLAGFTTAWSSTLDSAGAFIWDITNTDADSAAATGFIQLKHYDGADADVVYMKFVGDSDGAPTNDYVMSQTSFAVGAGIAMTIAGAPVMTTRTGVRRTVDINAGSMIPRTTNGAAPVTVELATNKIMYDGFAFDSTTERYVGFWWTPPTAYNGGTITIKPRWTAAGGSGNVKWDFKARAYAHDDPLDAALGTEQTSGTLTLTAVNDMNISATTPALTAAGTPAANRPEYFEAARDTATDTLSADAVLLGVTIEYIESATEPAAQ